MMGFAALYPSYELAQPGYTVGWVERSETHRTATMTNYRRHRVAGGCYFFTAAIHDRRLRLLTDHLHCIWTLPESDDNFSLRWRQIKTAFSRQIPLGEQRSSSRSDKGERGIWQRRYWEHAIRDGDDYQRHVDYIHYNPVKHGYVAQPAKWPHSSFRRFVRLGIYPHDWAGSGEIGLDEFGEVVGWVSLCSTHPTSGLASRHGMPLEARRSTITDKRPSVIA